jgi:hypothetical protein
MRSEVERLCEVGVLRKVNRSGGQHLPTLSRRRMDPHDSSLTRELNKRISRKPYPIPKIQEMLQNLEGSYATSIDLNMGYYHIELSPSPGSSVRLYCLGASTNTRNFRWAYVTALTSSREDE